MRLESYPHWPERWSAVLCAVIAAVLWIGPYVHRVDIFNNDAAHHIFWLYQYADASLFPNDISVQYFHTSAPWGYRALYQLVAPIADVLSAAEWLSIPLLMISLLLSWKIGVASSVIERPLYGLMTVVALILLLSWSGQKDLLPPIALQRTFALPLVLLTLWALICQKYVWVGLSWVAAALFYPVVLPVQGLTVAVVYGRALISTRQLPPRWLFNVIAGLIALSVAAFGVPVPTEIGPAISYEQAMRMEEFGPSGRLAMYQEAFVSNWFKGHRTGIGWSPFVLLAIAGGVGMAWVLGRLRSIPFAAWTMAAIGLGLWGVMRLFPEQLMFGLYLPNRHSRWALGVFGMLAIAGAAGALIERVRLGLDAQSSIQMAHIRVGVAICAPLLVMAALLPWAVAVAQRPVDRDLENVYSFVASLPESTLVAGHPDLANFIPVRSRRSVLTSTEISMAWMENYYKQMKPRLEASLRAAYATRIEDVDAEVGRYGVDIMVTGPTVWKTIGYFAPFDDLAKGLLERGLREGFALKTPPAERILYRSGDYYVVQVRDCGLIECK